HRPRCPRRPLRRRRRHRPGAGGGSLETPTHRSVLHSGCGIIDSGEQRDMEASGLRKLGWAVMGIILFLVHGYTSTLSMGAKGAQFVFWLFAACSGLLGGVMALVGLRTLSPLMLLGGLGLLVAAAFCIWAAREIPGIVEAGREF